MEWKRVKTQAEFDAAVKDGFGVDVTEGSFIASGSARVQASGFVHVRALGAATIKATKQVIVSLCLGYTGTATGGIQVKQKRPGKSIRAWAEHHGAEMEERYLIVYKGLNDDFASPKGASYKPGAAVIALDWDGGKQECGGGLHFSPRPDMTLEFHPGAKRFVKCKVLAKDCRPSKPEDEYPHKIKARACGVVCEVDINGKEIK